MKEFNKPMHHKLSSAFMEMIHSPRLGFLRGVFLANHLTRATKRQKTYQRKLTVHKKGP